jgi:hypothetical protein
VKEQDEPLECRECGQLLRTEREEKLAQLGERALEILRSKGRFMHYENRDIPESVVRATRATAGGSILDIAEALGLIAENEP